MWQTNQSIRRNNLGQNRLYFIGNCQEFLIEEQAFRIEEQKENRNNIFSLRTAEINEKCQEKLAKD